MKRMLFFQNARRGRGYLRTAGAVLLFALSIAASPHVSASTADWHYYLLRYEAGVGGGPVDGFRLYIDPLGQPEYSLDLPAYWASFSEEVLGQVIETSVPLPTTQVSLALVAFNRDSV